MMDLRGVDTPAREPAMPIFSIKLRPARIEELNELAELYNCNRADIVRYCICVGIPQLRRMLEGQEPRT